MMLRLGHCGSTPPSSWERDKTQGSVQPSGWVTGNLGMLLHKDGTLAPGHKRLVHLTPLHGMVNFPLLWVRFRKPATMEVATWTLLQVVVMGFPTAGTDTWYV